MSNTTGPKIAVVDSIPDGAVYGNDGRQFLRMFQALIQCNVINTTTTSPPGSPSNGDTYIIASGATGGWVGKDAFIAYWTLDDPNNPSGKWDYYAPVKGWLATSQANNGTYEFNGTAWVGQRTSSFNFQVDGGGSAITTGAKGQWDVPIACTITGWVLTADQSGSCVIDVLRSTYSGFPTTASIASTDKPTLSSAQKNENLSVSAWTTALAAGDQLQINVNSASTVTRTNLTVLVTIP
jgi:hypothetical protein